MPRCNMPFGTQHHMGLIVPPLRGADMSPQGWGNEGTFLSGGGFVRQSQDSHRQYMFEWSGASSREAAEYMQALRDGVYSKSRRDLIYFIDPNIYDKNILPKRWAQPGIVTSEYGPVYSVLGSVTPVDSNTPGVPLVGASVSSPFATVAAFNATTAPQRGSVWAPVPPGETLYVSAWTGDPVNSESGVYVRGQNLDGTWNPASLVEGIGFIGSGLRGVLVGTVGEFDFYAARAALDLPPSQRPVSYAWTGTPDNSTSTRTTVDGTVTNLFTNPRNVSVGAPVVVWENLYLGGNLTPSSQYADREVLDGLEGTKLTQTAGWATNIAVATMGDNAALGQTFTVTWEVENLNSDPLEFSLRLYNGTEYVTDAEVMTTIPPGESRRVFGTTTTNGATTGGVSARLHTSGLYDASNGYEIIVRKPVIMPIAHPVDIYFDETYSPDPDLTPKPRPGGGSILTGLPVQRHAAVGGVVVQSSQWPGRDTTARFIQNTGRPSSYVSILDGTSIANTVLVWRYQDRVLDYIGTPANNGTIYVMNPRENSEAAPNIAGETLLRVDRQVAEGAVVLYGGQSLGESLWFDLLTATDTPNYDGPPFSGDTPDITPEWSPGLGHSGCAFVGNPTWSATSGVNGGQVGYAATLREVGDWL